jgi:hypothetical protein
MAFISRPPLSGVRRRAWPRRSRSPRTASTGHLDQYRLGGLGEPWRGSHTSCSAARRRGYEPNGPPRGLPCRTPLRMPIRYHRKLSGSICVRIRSTTRVSKWIHAQSCGSPGDDWRALQIADSMFGAAARLGREDTARASLEPRVLAQKHFGAAAGVRSNAPDDQHREEQNEREV